MKLTNKNIAAALEEIEKFFEAVQVSKTDKIKICLTLEESLLRFQEKFGENTEFKFVTHKWLGNPKVLIKVKDKPYNPIEDDGDEQIFSQSIMQNLLNYEGAGIIYRYENGCNEVSAFSKKEVKRLKIPGGSITVSILLAIVAALLVEKFLSAPVQNILIENIATPISNALFGTIIAVNLPLVFIAIVASVASIDDISILNSVGKKIMKRFLAMMFGIAIFSIFVSEIFFPVMNLNLGGENLTARSLELQKLFDLILSIFPQNVITPFSERNIFQIVVFALIFGMSITILSDRVTEVKNLILNLKQIIFKMVDIVMKLVPVLTFLCIFKLILSDFSGQFLTLWKLVVSQYLTYFIVCSFLLLKNYFLYDIKILDFLKKIYPACLIAFTTVSGSASMPRNIEICKKDLRIDEKLCDFYIPLSHVLCQTVRIISLVVYVFFAAEFSDAQFSISQLIIIVFLTIQFSIASANGTGGIVATLGLLFTQLDLSLDAIGAIMMANVFVTNASVVIAMIIRDCDLIDVSHKVKL